MSHDFNLAGTRGPSARTIVPYSVSGPHYPGRSPSQHPTKDGLRAVVLPILPRRRTDWTVENTDRLGTLITVHPCYPSSNPVERLPADNFL